MTPGTSAQLSVPALRSSVAAARHAVTQVCDSAGVGQLCDVAALLTSEIVTNAVLHGEGTVQVRAQVTGSGLRVEVQDDGAGRPAPRHAEPMDEGGRGMQLLTQLSTAWGVDELGRGKVVWFLLDGGTPA